MLIPALIFAGAALLVLSRRAPSVSTGVERGQLYRLHVKTRPAYVETIRAAYGELGQKKLLRDVEQRVEEMGFSGTLLSMQDPTDGTLFTIISRRTVNGAVVQPTSSPVTLVGMEPVEEPHTVDRLYVTTPEALDSGLSPEEIMTVRQALLEDMNPRHLNGIAHTFEPFFPVAASLLRAKADVLDLRKLPSTKSSREADLKLRRVLKNIREISLGLSTQELPASVRIQLLNARGLLESLAQRRKLPTSIIRDELRRLASMFIEHDEKDDISRFPTEMVRIVPLLLREIFKADNGQRVFVIDPRRLNVVIPPSEYDNFISPSAIQLALATSKPRSSGVLKPLKAPERYDSLLNTNGKDWSELKARAQMERANKALERRRWVDWFRRKTLVAARKT
jgi:hypothetical protein